NMGKREHSSLAQGQGDARGTLSAGRRLGEDKGKFLVQPANDLERRDRCLDVRLTRSCRNETKVCRPNGSGNKIVVAAGRVNDRQRAASLLEGAQGALELEPIGDPLDDRFGVNSTRRPVRDRALAIGLQYEDTLAILHGGDRQTDT